MKLPNKNRGLEDVNLWFQNTNGEASNFGDMAVKRMQGSGFRA